MTVPADSPWLTREQVAQRLGVPETTVKYWAATGKGPRSAKFGRHIRYHIDHVITWEQEQVRGEAS